MIGLVQLEHLVVGVLEKEPLLARVHALVGHRVAALPRGGSGEGGSEVHGQRLARTGVPLAQIARDVVHAIGEQLVHIGVLRPVHLGDVVDLLGRQRPEVDGGQKIVECRATLEGRDHVGRHRSRLRREILLHIFHKTPLSPLGHVSRLIGDAPFGPPAFRCQTRIGTDAHRLRRGRPWSPVGPELTRHRGMRAAQAPPLRSCVGSGLTACPAIFRPPKREGGAAGRRGPNEGAPQGWMWRPLREYRRYFFS